MPITNIGSGSIREESDRKVPTELDPECKRSQARGNRDAGLNKQTMNESLAELNQGVRIDGHTDSDGEFDGQVRNGELDGLGRN